MHTVIPINVTDDIMLSNTQQLYKLQAVQLLGNTTSYLRVPKAQCV